MVGFFSYFYSQSVRTAMEEDIKSDEEYISSKMVFTENCLYRACEYIGNEKYIIRVLNTEFDSDIDNISETKYITESVNNIFGTLFDIQSYAYAPKVQFYINKDLAFAQNRYMMKQSNDGTLLSAAAAENEEWFGEVMEKDSGISIFTKASEPEYIFMAKKVFDYESNYCGFCVTGISLDYLFMMQRPVHSVVCDKNGKIIFNTVENFNQEEYENKILADESVRNNVFDLVKIFDGKFFVGRNNLDIGLGYTLFVKEGDVNSHIDAVYYVLFSAILLVILLAMMFFLTISKTVVAPLVKLAGIMKKGSGAIVDEADIKKAGDDEIGAIYRAYSDMLVKAEELKRTEREAIETKNRMELRMCQAQIGPHFLNNALNAISCKALLDGYDEIADYSAKLASISGYGLRRPEQMVTLKEEIKYLNDYIEFQRFVYDGNISARINVDEECESLMVVKFILQPIVENSIKHNSISDEKKLEIKIDVFAENEYLIIEIADSGNSCDASELNKKIYDDTEGIGLKNVNYRLRIKFGNECGLSYSNRDNSLVATLKILKIKSGDKRSL